VRTTVPSGLVMNFDLEKLAQTAAAKTPWPQ
jgi:hypothetical protein